MKISFLSTIIVFLSVTAFGQIKLEKRSFINGKVEMLIPTAFKLMDKSMMDVKYPNRTQQPNAVLTDEDATVNVVISYLPQQINASQVEAFKEFQLNSLKRSRPDGEWLDNGVKKVNGKNVGYIKFMIRAVDQKVFNYMFFTDLDGKVFLVSFNCTEKQLPEWKDAAESIFASLTVK